VDAGSPSCGWQRTKLTERWRRGEWERREKAAGWMNAQNHSEQRQKERGETYHLNCLARSVVGGRQSCCSQAQNELKDGCEVGFRAGMLDTARKHDWDKDRVRRSVGGWWRENMYFACASVSDVKRCKRDRVGEVK
jgi:hypothetical protein